MMRMPAAYPMHWRSQLALVVLVLLLVTPAGFAVNARFTANLEPVTGHTIYAERIILERDRAGNGLPTDFAAVAGHFMVGAGAERNLQRECVTWFDGRNLDQRPIADPNGTGSRNAFPSDGEEDDAAMQDYDFDRDVDGCLPRWVDVKARQTGAFAVVVESGDCDPALGRDWIFRGHLDFVDPNNMYHEVQEYSYVCPFGGPGNRVPNPAFPGQPGGWSEAVRQLLPSGLPPPPDRPCNQVPPPHEEIDVENGSVGDPSQFLFCNTRIQALFREMIWITPIHDEVWDPTIQRLYNFALQIDTCDGTGCTDGSRDSFDDTSRSRVSHRGPPADEEDVMRGNSYDFDGNSTTFGKHRTNCRAVFVAWRGVSERPGPFGDDCYPEDHKAAAIDIYVAFADPTGGLWAANANGLTGANAYVGPGTPSGPLYRGPGDG